MNLPPASLFVSSNARPVARVDNTSRSESGPTFFGFRSLSSLAQVSFPSYNVPVRSPSVSSFVSMGDRPVYRDGQPSSASSEASFPSFGAFRMAPFGDSHSKFGVSKSLSAGLPSPKYAPSMPSIVPQSSPPYVPGLLSNNFSNSSLMTPKAKYLRPLCVARSIFQCFVALEEEHGKFDDSLCFRTNYKRKLESSQENHCSKRSCSSPLCSSPGAKLPDSDDVKVLESFVASTTAAVESFFSRFIACAGSCCDATPSLVETRLASLLNHESSPSSPSRHSLDQHIEQLFNANYLTRDSKVPNNA